MEINWLSGFIASFLGLIIGYLWYSVLFAKKWQELAGISDALLQQGMPKRAIGSYIMSLVMSLNLAAFIGADATPLFGLTAGLAAGLGWVAMALGSNYLFEHKPFQLYLINAGYNIILLSLMGLVIGLF